ncbi:MAG: hypothetical protein ACI835_003465 [Planctomycetota bacterium]|jgi:hypothetical protein
MANDLTCRSCQEKRPMQQCGGLQQITQRLFQAGGHKLGTSEVWLEFHIH